MSELKVSNLKPGMILGGDIEQGSKRVLAKGTVITDSHIRLLRTWKIDTVLIEEPPLATAQPPTAVDGGAQAVLAATFNNALTNSVMKALYSQAQSRLSADYYWRSGGPQEKAR